MQNELTALRPQLLETSDETEKLMIKIEQDTIQVENIKKDTNWYRILKNMIKIEEDTLQVGNIKNKLL